MVLSGVVSSASARGVCGSGACETASGARTLPLTAFGHPGPHRAAGEPQTSARLNRASRQSNHTILFAYDSVFNSDRAAVVKAARLAKRQPDYFLSGKAAILISG